MSRLYMSTSDTQVTWRLYSQ